MINKLRALNSWYTKGLVGGSDLRVSINSAESIDHLREIIIKFFGVGVPAGGILARVGQHFATGDPADPHLAGVGEARHVHVAVEEAEVVEEDDDDKEDWDE